jgi:hypothetical protein
MVRTIDPDPIGEGAGQRQRNLWLRIAMSRGLGVV